MEARERGMQRERRRRRQPAMTMMRKNTMTSTKMLMFAMLYAIVSCVDGFNLLPRCGLALVVNPPSPSSWSRPAVCSSSSSRMQTRKGRLRVVCEQKNAEEEVDKEEERRRKIERAQQIIGKVRSQGEVDGTTGIGGAWSPPENVESHKPKVSTWGVYERPADISKAFGGGRRVGLGGYTQSEEEKQESTAKTMQKLMEYRKSVGVDRKLEEEHMEEIKQALAKYDKLMSSGAVSRAVAALEEVTKWTSYKTALGGQVYLNLALAYEQLGERPKAKSTYTRLVGNGDPNVSSKAKELLYGFEAMDFLRVNATVRSEERKVMSFKLPEVWEYTNKRYDTSFFEKSKQKPQTAGARGSGIWGSRTSVTGGEEVDLSQSPERRKEGEEEDADVIIVGSGVAGLSCAAVLSKYGYKVRVLESHVHAGGAAHSFELRGERGTFKFDSGPSLYSGLSVDDRTMRSQQRCVNPLKQVLDLVDEEVPCLRYDTWGVCLPEGDFPATVGADAFAEDLRRLFPGEQGEAAAQEWRKLQAYMAPLAAASVAIPPAAIRFDLGLVATLLRFLPSLLNPRAVSLLGPYSKVLEEAGVRNRFIRNWLDMLCFLLSGLPADGTIAAEVAFMFAEWYRPGVQLDYPVGGSEGIIKALVRGIEKHGGEVRLKAHVEAIVVEQGEAKGVTLRGGEKMRAKKAVISNASLKSTLRLLPPDAVPEEWRREQEETKECPSFMHLHLGFDAAGLKEAMGGKELCCHYMVVNDWERGVEAEQNLVLISIPSVLDPSLAPDGMHALHAYTPATEPYDLWKDLKRDSPEYLKLKEERSQVLWKAVERVIPDIRARAELVKIGSPLTHERFLRRHRGSYGPALKAGKDLFPGPRTPISRLLLCGDSVFPGIGMPAVRRGAEEEEEEEEEEVVVVVVVVVVEEEEEEEVMPWQVAASGMIAANSLGLETLGKHQKLLDALVLE